MVATLSAFLLVEINQLIDYKVAKLAEFSGILQKLASHLNRSFSLKIRITFLICCYTEAAIIYEENV